jgi:hypothetical protein
VLSSLDMFFFLILESFNWVDLVFSENFNKMLSHRIYLFNTSFNLKILGMNSLYCKDDSV